MVEIIAGENHGANFGFMMIHSSRQCRLQSHFWGFYSFEKLELL